MATAKRQPKTEPQYVVRGIDITEKNAPDLMLGRRGCDKCAGYGHAECKTCCGDGETSCGNPCCDGGHKCHACNGTGGGPCSCFADERSGRAILAAEATRLWKRDVGRNILTGKAETYIAFAVRAANDGEIAGVEVVDE